MSRLRVPKGGGEELTPAWTIVCSVVSGAIVAAIVSWMTKSRKNDDDIRSFHSWKEYHEEIHKLLAKELENQLGPINKRLEVLGDRAHDHGQDLSTLFAILGHDRPKRRRKEIPWPRNSQEQQD